MKCCEYDPWCRIAISCTNSQILGCGWPKGLYSQTLDKDRLLNLLSKYYKVIVVYIQRAQHALTGIACTRLFYMGLTFSKGYRARVFK